MMNSYSWLYNYLVNSKSNKKDTNKQIIAFIGKAGSGKDHQCNLLQQKGYKKLAFADALRDIAYSSFNIPLSIGLQSYDDMKKDNNCITIKTNDETYTLSFRKYLEHLGTQGIRKYVPDFWVICLTNTILKNNYDNVCISDLRFINEYTKIKQFAQQNNYRFKCIFCNFHSDRYQENNLHESAWLANNLCNMGYKDLQEIQDVDIQKLKQV